MSALSPAMLRLLDTPKKTKRQREQSAEAVTPDNAKSFRPMEKMLAAGNELAQVAKPLVRVDCKASEATAEKIAKLADEHAVLSRLFGGLDLVILLLHGRRRAPLSVVREHVETATGRDLTDDRLKQVLALAGDMFEVKWKGMGHDAVLEFAQRVSGELRPPSTPEQWQRKARFDQDLLTAVAYGTVPQQELPERPASPKHNDMQLLDAADPAMLALPAPKRRESAGSQAAFSVAERQDALLARVRAREAANNSTEAQAFDQVRDKISVCDNAMTLHAVIQSLFARGQGGNSAASEAEVLRAACSASFGAQAVRPMDKAAAEMALEQLILRSTSWFNLEHGKHVQGARYLKRQPRGQAVAVMSVLQAERRDLEQQLQSLKQCVKDKQCGMQVGSFDASRSKQKLKVGALAAGASEQPLALKAPAAAQRTRSAPAAVQGKRQTTETREASSKKKQRTHH
mmetsp:Transcript_53123/g.99577  ORF Transcript_53123/g.99577 Transcript_53123/m.99577 type:complete len:458 (+) Transcript_53123:87-1460(+)